MSENLTLENFWNELHSKFPVGTQVFCDWVDKYKAEHNWPVLFNPKYRVVEEPTAIFSPPKFHDLPFAFQLGMWMEFAYEYGKEDGETIAEFFEFDLRVEITQAVEKIQKKYNGN